MLPKYYLPLWSLVLFLLCFLLFVPEAQASTLLLQPQNFTVQNGKTIQLKIKVDTKGEYVNAVTAALVYPADQLEAIWLSYDGSAFPVSVEALYGGGAIRITRGSLVGVRGVVDVATVTLKGKAAGTGDLVFTEHSIVPKLSDSSNSLDLPASLGGSFEVKDVLAKQPVPSGLLIVDLATTPLSTDSAIISWRTEKPADSRIDYGLEDGKYILSAADAALVTDHRMKLQSYLFIPGQELHYKVASRDKTGNFGSSADTLYRVKGYSMTVKVVDGANKPIQGAEVSVYSQAVRVVTNQQGEAVFNDLSLGSHLVLVKYGSFEKSGEVKVIDSAEPQLFGLMVDTPKAEKTAQFEFKDPYLNVGLGVFSGLMGLFWVLLRKKKLGIETVKVVTPGTGESQPQKP